MNNEMRQQKLGYVYQARKNFIIKKKKRKKKKIYFAYKEKLVYFEVQFL